MTHYVGLVVADDPETVARVLAPYSESLRLAPYTRYVAGDDLQRMRDYYESMARGPLTLDELCAKMSDWMGERGRVDGVRLAYDSTYNLRCRWDWYVIGGRWAGLVPGECCPAGQVEQLFAQKSYFPAVLVDGAGWHAEKEYGWFGSEAAAADPADVRALLAAAGEARVYVVDFHGA